MIPYEIDQEAFQYAFDASRRYAGMGSLALTLLFNPYECVWEYKAVIDFSDSTTYTSRAKNSADALRTVGDAVHANPPKTHTDP